MATPPAYSAPSGNFPTFPRSQFIWPGRECPAKTPNGKSFLPFCVLVLPWHFPTHFPAAIQLNLPCLIYLINFFLSHLPWQPDQPTAIVEESSMSRLYFKCFHRFPFCRFSSSLFLSGRLPEKFLMLEFENMRTEQRENTWRTVAVQYYSICHYSFIPK